MTNTNNLCDQEIKRQNQFYGEQYEQMKQKFDS